MAFVNKFMVDDGDRCFIDSEDLIGYPLGNDQVCLVNGIQKWQK